MKVSLSAIELTKNYCFSEGKSLVSVCCYLWKESMFTLLLHSFQTMTQFQTDLHVMLWWLGR